MIKLTQKKVTCAQCRTCFNSRNMVNANGEVDKWCVDCYTRRISEENDIYAQQYLLMGLVNWKWGHEASVDFSIGWDEAVHQQNRIHAKYRQRIIDVLKCRDIDKMKDYYKALSDELHELCEKDKEASK